MTLTTDDAGGKSATLTPLPSDPPWLQHAWADLGQAETPGPANAGWLFTLRDLLPRWVRAWYVDDSAQAWCGLFVGACLVKAGQKIPKNPLSALAYREVGWVTTLDDAARGDLVMLSRTGGGHVGFYLAADATTVTLLSGNSKDRVGVDSFPRGRVVSVRAL